MRFRLLLPFLVLPFFVGAPALALEWHGQVEARAALDDVAPSWAHGDLGKTQFDDHFDLAQGARAVLNVSQQLPASLSASATAAALGDRSQWLDLQEATLNWRPIPEGPWRTRVRAGSFFLPASEEVAYDSVGWAPVRTLSASAINSWIAQELRTTGVELSLLRRGALVDSPHEYGLTVAAFGGNDPAGTLIAWQGWTLGDRITGLTERLRLPDLPVYRPSGEIPRQTRDVHLFREIDDRVGGYVAATYAYGTVLRVSLLHYDNRADPLRVEGGQYGWHTRFDHFGWRLRAPGGWELLGQALRGSTLMGPNAVHVRFESAYVLASHALGAGQITLRWDGFDTTDIDVLPSDPNGEHGTALALAWRRPLVGKLQLIGEALYIDSTRAARAELAEDPRQIERRLSVALRWAF